MKTLPYQFRQTDLFELLSFSSSITKLNGPLDGWEAKEEGMAAAEAGTKPEYVEAARQVVRSVACRQLEFTSDDIVEALAALNIHPPKLLFLGSVMTYMAKAGVCKKIPKTLPCRRKSRHATQLQVWQSLIFSPLFS